MSEGQKHRRVGIAALAAAVVFAGLTLAVPARAQGGGPVLDLAPERNLNGVWWAASYDAKIEPAGGGELPFTAEGRAVYAANMAGLANGTLTDQARYTCTPDGVPRIWHTVYPFQILLSPEQVTIVYEQSHVFRVAPFDQPLPDAEILEILPYFSGHSVASWEADTLVIETAGYKDTTFLDDTGVPNSNELTTIERLRLMDGGNRLEVEVAIDDPAIFTAPWTARYIFEKRPDVRLLTQVCGERHRDVSHIPGAP